LKDKKSLPIENIICRADHVRIIHSPTFIPLVFIKGYANRCSRLKILKKKIIIIK